MNVRTDAPLQTYFARIGLFVHKVHSQEARSYEL
jgi:hypothetical protein